ncbi:5-phosphohydroxy-L-lysine phospho-lyase-like [Tubulanus polymorphus]|uniref:5-phosphohydroxy-L-lysine phospho-lyase-like n=1 Tax=Tubulanus polymorphus TaxID=672921 RepID=UPI003DA24C49
MLEKPSYKQTLEMRRHYLGRSCKLHFDVSPMKLVRASKQYMYDDNGIEYLDCISIMAHVGHCHAKVVHAGNQQMSKIGASYGFISDVQSVYAKRLIETLPHGLCVCYFVNSGSEACDLAVRLARTYTGHKDVICLEDSFNGSTSVSLEVSPAMWKKMRNHKQKSWSHVAPTPDLYRGKYAGDPHAIQKYLQDSSLMMQSAQAEGRQFAGLIHESVFSHVGMINPPKNYWKSFYSMVRDSGGVCIANECSTGLGRCGETFWGFQMHDVVPDIVVVGKPLGNGQPMAVVITTKEIADCLTQFSSSHGGNPVVCSVGLAVLDVIRDEKLMSAAKNVGKCLLDGFRAIMPQHPMLGHVRGIGLMIGLEIVTDKMSRKPSSEVAELLTYKMKDACIIVNNSGPDKNVITISPPMCFTCDNARRLIQTFDRCLGEIELQQSSSRGGGGAASDSRREFDHIPVNVLSGMINNSDDKMGSCSDDDEYTPDCKRPRYEDLD